MDILNVDLSNIDSEHICCAISDKKGETCVSSKKDWMKKQFDEGLVFKKLNARGKVFIEYIPAENAWCPIDAENYLFINCFWVSGQFKGQGYSNKLMEACIADAKSQNKKGLVILSSKKKLPFDETDTLPTFKQCCKDSTLEEKGMVLYYSNQCPHTDKYAPLIAEIAHSKGTKLILRKIDSKEAAQSAPAPFTTYSFFDEGKFVTNEIFSESKFMKYLEGKGL